MPRIEQWIKSLKPAALRGLLRLYINSALSDFVHSPDGRTNDPLEMPAHDYALKSRLWLMSTQQSFPHLKLKEFMHGATV